MQFITLLLNSFFIYFGRSLFVSFQIHICGYLFYANITQQFKYTCRRRLLYCSVTCEADWISEKLVGGSLSSVVGQECPIKQHCQRYKSNPYMWCIGQCSTTSIENSLEKSANDYIGSFVLWRSIIGDICQLSSFPRPTTDPNKYIECVFQAENAGNRNDLGIWVSKDCPTGYQFVAPARECKIDRLVKARQQLCDGPNAEKYKFCPSLKGGPKFIVKSVERHKDQCSCSAEDENCECPKVVVIELVTYKGVMNGSNIPKVRQARQLVCQGQERCVTTGDNCGDCLSASGICTCGASDSTYLLGGTKLARKEIPKGCLLLHNGQLHCPLIQEQIKNQQHSDIIAPQACPIAVEHDVADARYQRICSWMIEPLVTDPESPSHFLQCQPAANSLYCGRWQRMPCAAGLIFNALLQVCVWNSGTQPGQIPIATHRPHIIATYPLISHLPHASTRYRISPESVIPWYGANTQCTCHTGVQIGSCGSDGQCPGQSICKSKQITEQGSCPVCCYYSQGTE